MASCGTVNRAAALCGFPPHMRSVRSKRIMSTAIIATVIASLILLAIGLSLKIAQLSYRLNSHSDSERNHLKEISDAQKTIPELGEEQSVFAGGAYPREPM